MNQNKPAKSCSGCCGGCLNRRRFLGAAGASLALGALGGLSFAADVKRPLVDIGTLKDYAKDAIWEDFAAEDFLVIRNNGILFAASTTCTHQGNTLRRDPKDDTRIACEKHGSTFDSEGLVQVGPATTGVTRFGIAINDKGRIEVNRNVEYPQDKWSDKASFIEMK